MLSGPRSTVTRARQLRRTMSLPEILLWRELRARPDGFKFRRQHPAGHYVLDFFCAQAQLAIEVDGQAHDRGTRPADDTARDTWLNARGVDVLRIPAQTILANIDDVVRHIVAKAHGRSPLHRPSDGPPPRSGEEF